VPPFAGFFSKDEIIGAAWLGAGGYNPFSTSTLFGVAGSTWMALFGIVLSVAAFITAFYMARMMIYTFFGTNRTGDAERAHLHEGSWTLKVPLLVLAALSVVGGLANVEPDVPLVNLFDWGQGAWLHYFLYPVTDEPTAAIRANLAQIGDVPHALWPILLAIVIGLGGLAAAWFLLGDKRLGTADEHPAYRPGFERVLYNKYYVDEAYDRAVVRPLVGVSRLQAWFDRVVVDGFVDFFGRTAQALGLWLGRLQTGHLNTYALMVVVGVLALLGSFVAF
jgi:NADH-quinone oxidoreductase subunit L